MSTVTGTITGGADIRYSDPINLSVTVSSASFTFPLKFKGMVISSNTDCWVRFDRADVSSSNGFFIKAGEFYNLPVIYPTSIQYIRDSADGRLTIIGHRETAGSF